MRKKIKCKVCSHRFTPDKADRYIATEKSISLFCSERKDYECFDCPMCGCQNPVNVHMPTDGDDPCNKEENPDG